jgi:hypothetical protein
MITFMPGERASLSGVLEEVPEERSDEVLATHCQAMGTLQKRLIRLGKNAKEIPGQDRDWLERQVDFAADAVEELAIDLACVLWVRAGDHLEDFETRRVAPLSRRSPSREWCGT